MTPTADCDVLVVGSGVAGLATAISAAHHGLAAIVVEREALVGGTSALSGGWIYAPGNHRGRRESGDTREEVVRYLHALAGDHYRPEHVSAFLDGVPDAIDFFESKTAVRFVYPSRAPDYRMELPGARIGGRAMHAEPFDLRELGRDRRRMLRSPMREMTIFGVVPQIGADLEQFVRANQSVRAFAYVMRRIAKSTAERLRYGQPVHVSNGNALVARLLKSAEDAQIPILTSTRVQQLAVSSGGIVDGVELASAEGRRVVKARKAVVLACGGFSHDVQVRDRVFPHRGAGQPHYSATTPSNDGDAQRLTATLGVGLMDAVGQPAAWAPVTAFGDDRRRLFPHLRGIGLPGLIAVDIDGRRFVNEADSYHDFGRALIERGLDRPGMQAFLVADRRTMRRYGIGYAKPWPMPQLPYLLNGYLYRGRTLSELARRAGIDADGLAKTLAAFNEHAQRGQDPEYHRGESEYNRFRGDPRHEPNPAIGPIEQPPFYAVRVDLGDLGTFAGLPTNALSQVLTKAGEPIPGLYAVGSTAASVFGGAYPGYGAMLGPALTFGYLTGRDLAR